MCFNYGYGKNHPHANDIARLIGVDPKPAPASLPRNIFYRKYKDEVNACRKLFHLPSLPQQTLANSVSQLIGIAAILAHRMASQ